MDPAGPVRSSGTVSSRAKSRCRTCYRPLLIQGLQQARDTRVPIVSIHRQFRILVEDELGAAPAGERRLVAHPGRGPSALTLGPGPQRPRVLVAVGPEGGWNTFELGLLERAGFEAVSLGPRILRVETAMAAVIGRLY